MTIDEAIKHCLEVAEQNDTQADKWQEEGGEQWGKTTACRECAAEHRQLGEWLTELKNLREENKVLMQECDRLIKEKGELLKQHKQIAEYKRLLKVAVEDINATEACDTCEYYPVINSDACQKDDCYKWRYADEALKLIEG